VLTVSPSRGRSEQRLEIVLGSRPVRSWDEVTRGVPSRRPWWWWLAFWFYASAVLLELWVMYRTLAGHPILGGLWVRIGG
jgi:hypothetical protein